MKDKTIFLLVIAATVWIWAYTALVHILFDAHLEAIYYLDAVAPILLILSGLITASIYYVFKLMVGKHAKKTR